MKIVSILLMLFCVSGCSPGVDVGQSNIGQPDIFRARIILDKLGDPWPMMLDNGWFEYTAVIQMDEFCCCDTSLVYCRSWNYRWSDTVTVVRVVSPTPHGRAWWEIIPEVEDE